MSVAEIISEVRTLTPDQRSEIRQLINELDPHSLIDSEELLPAEIELIDSRLDECEKHPERFSPLAESKARVMAKFKK